MTDVLAPLRVVVTLLAAVLAVGGLVVLRADSDGSAPEGLTLVVATAVVAVALWPLTRRPGRTALLLGALVAVQLSGHLLVLAGSGGPRGVTDLVCCGPSPAPAGGGVLAALTAQAGPLLLAVQVLAALLLALSVRGLDGVLLSVARAVAGAVHSVLPALRVLLATPLQAVPAVARLDAHPAPWAPRSWHVATAVRRRGPPVGGSVLPPFLPRGACAL